MGGDVVLTMPQDCANSSLLHISFFLSSALNTEPVHICVLKPVGCTQPGLATVIAPCHCDRGDTSLRTQHLGSY